MSATWTLTLPVTAGTANYILITDGSGVSSWSAITNSNWFATASVAGTVSTASQTLAGAKTFSDSLTVGTDTTTSSRAIELRVDDTANNEQPTFDIYRDGTVRATLGVAGAANALGPGSGNTAENDFVMRLNSQALVVTCDNASTLHGKCTSAGEWSFPVQPSASVYLSADQTGIADATPTKITFNTEEFDANADFDSSTNNRFTAPVAGKYLVAATASVNRTGGTGISRIKLMLYKNGSEFKVLSDINFSTATTNDQTANGAITVELAATDYLEIWVRISGTGTLVTKLYSGAANTFAAFHKVA